MGTSGLLRAACAVWMALLAAAIPALAGPSPQRTVRVRLAKTGDPNGPSGEVSLSGDGLRVAFSSRATDLRGPDANGDVRDVYLYDQGSGGIARMSDGLGGAGADGASREPSISRDGRTVAYVSSATNLVDGDTNKVADVFAAGPDGLARVSVASDGTQADKPSSSPDVSGDGRLVVFASDATNLVAGDTNGATDVFVHDLRTGATTLVSAAADGGPADRGSLAPAISPDGRFVSFTSSARNLVAGDKNGKPDVFVRDLDAGTTELVSIASEGRQQNRSLARKLTQASDVSEGGRFVVFDSDATNLVRHDRNHHTDVFVRDRQALRTSRASLGITNQQGSGDSYLPSITPDGRYVAFTSLADDLVVGDARGQDVFVRDLQAHTTALADVGSHGERRGREHSRRLEIRGSMSDDAATVGFASSASNLVTSDRNRTADVFLRRMTPAATGAASKSAGIQRGRLVITLRSSERRAWPMRCTLDHRAPALCPLGGLVLPRLRGGRHLLTAYAGAPGSLWARRPILVRIRIRKGHARVHVRNPGAT